jgi:hypothetical protein
VVVVVVVGECSSIEGVLYVMKFSVNESHYSMYRGI